MAFAATTLTDGSRLQQPYSIGRAKVQHMTYTAVSGDASGTITVPGLAEVQYVQLQGLVLSAATTYSGNVATITFINPLATVSGTLTAYGI